MENSSLGSQTRLQLGVGQQFAGGGGEPDAGRMVKVIPELACPLHGQRRQWPTQGHQQGVDLQMVVAEGVAKCRQRRK